MGRGGGADSSLHPTFRRKGGAPAPLQPPPWLRAMVYIIVPKYERKEINEINQDRFQDIRLKTQTLNLR